MTTVTTGNRHGGSIADAVRLTYRGALPPRYDEPYRAEFDRRVAAALAPGLRVLDVGAGKRPTVPADRRPPGCEYVGLDISAEELAKAGAGAYDRVAVSDVTRRVPELEGHFDLILSWQVLEHVRRLDDALGHLRSYLRPGGRLVAQLSGGRSAFALANRLLPERLGRWALVRLVGKHPENVFPAYYDRCSHDAIDRLLDGWSQHEIVPLFVGARPYFDFSRVARAAYVGYEEWTYRADRHNLASYYVIDAVR